MQAVSVVKRATPGKIKEERDFDAKKCNKFYCLTTLNVFRQTRAYHRYLKCVI